jgi:ABC-type multidrug transport system ATPase subunit
MFGDQIAVNNLKMSIKYGEIFTILGHNGAGKTTAIYMLTGVLSPSSGDASIYGNKVSESMTKI